MEAEGMEAEGMEAEQEKPSTPEEYLKKTLLMDIETASYYELREWLERLELSTEGDRRSLKQRLVQHYEIEVGKEAEKESELAEKQPTEPEELSIDRAGKLEFYAEEKEGRPEIRITGGVRIYMLDEKNGTTHRIEANSLVFNREERRLTATGDVLYEMDKGENTETFTGKEISFDVNNYRGLFIGGMSKRSRNVEGEEISFYFRGDVIYRPENDRVYLDRGMISSSTVEDPYYHVAAQQLWVLGPDEWAFNDALLYIGRIPVFYFPFFFHPGDDILFYPSFGYRNIEGYYFQTTTYLLGRKKQEGKNENSLSFLQIVEEDSSKYKRERHGLFLRQTEEPVENTWEYNSDSFVKFLLDYYSRLGLFSGFHIDINDLGMLKALDGSLGIGFTDYIFPRSGFEAYTSFMYREETNTYRRLSHEPWVFGSPMTYRFAFDIEAELDVKSFSWKAAFPLYSDPYFHNKFKGRDEQILWGSLLQGEEESIFEDDPLENPEFYSGIYYDVPIPEDFRLIQSFSVDRFDSSLVLNDEDLPEDVRTYDDAQSPENPLGFYYPELITPIDTAVTLKGEIFNSDIEKKKRDQKKDEKVPESIRPPWATAEKSEKEESTREEGDEGLRIPEGFTEVEEYARKRPETYSHSLDYLFSPDFSCNARYDQEQRNDPAAVNFEPLFSYTDSSWNGEFSYGSRLFGPYAVFGNDLSFEGRYREHYPEEDDIDLSDDKYKDKTLSYFNINNEFRFKSMFLYEYDELDTSNLSYRLKTLMFNYSFDEEKEEFLPKYAQWDEESIESHDLSMDIVRKVKTNQQSIFVEGSLPPVAPDNMGGAAMRQGPLETEVKYRTRKEELESEEWIYGPLDAMAKLNLRERSYLLQQLHLYIPENDDYSHTDLTLAFLEGNVGVGQVYDWNIDQDRPEKAKSSLTLWFLTGAVEYRHMNGFEYVFGKGWVEQEPAGFLPYRTTAKIDARYSPDPVWKNRIRLDTGITGAFHIDMQKFTDNVLGLDLDVEASIVEFFDLSLTLRTENSGIYQYISSYADELGVERKRPLQDFMRSLNIFNSDKRLDTNFNLKSLAVDAVHHMHDWDLSFIYEGEPVLDDEQKRYRWKSKFTIMVQWKPIPEIKKEAEYKEKEYVF